MTIVKKLAEQTVRGETVTAYEVWDKHYAAPEYRIDLARGGMVYTTIKTARTTWRKKFRELTLTE